MDSKRTFTDEQLEALKPFEHHFKTAVRSRYARRVGGDETVRRIADTYKAATGIQLPVYASCQDCMLRLLTQVGKAYLKDLDIIAMESIEKNAEKVVSLAKAADEQTEKRGPVKTVKPGRKPGKTSKK